ncbi:MAG: DUF3857 domain-containing protein, partial [Chloroflexi bacterium]|nr:DUF3857 domain-containing protein [Chloroflexota bacterium]
MALTVVLVHGSPAWAAPRADGGAVDLNITAARFPGEDAIILRWEQHWTLEKDGTVRRRDHRWVKLLNSRPIRRYADPRVDFVSGEEKLIIHTAQTHLPDGTILPVPDYSFNASAPGDVGRWPGYADWQQKVISFSGIEDGAVVELDYEVVTPPGVLPWIQADLRLHGVDPTVERVVRVTVPKGTILHHRVDGVEPPTIPATEADRDGAITYAWTFKDLASGRGEPQSLPWQQRCGRLR